jgi:hypothetical protein
MRRLAHLHHKEHINQEPVWHVQIALISIIALQLLLDRQLTVGPKYAVITFELVLLLILMLIAHTVTGLFVRRTLAILLTALVTVSNILSLGLVIGTLFDGRQVNGRTLLISALSIYLTNIIIFGLWYWEMEFKRGAKPQDFLFPQENAPEHAGLHLMGWRPSFFDYLYVSVTNAAAFSPTDTLPLTHRAKLLMSTQSLVSLSIVILVTARAVNIIG